MIKVVVVDDHDLVREGLRRMLDDIPGIKVVGEARDGKGAINITKEKVPNVILLDLKMPDMDGFVVTEKLLRVDPDLKILVVTVCEDELFPARLLQAGASGYLTKGASLVEMVQAIRAVHSGQRYISPMIAQQLAIKHITDSEKSPFEALSDREFEVMLMIIRGMKPQEISSQLCLSAKTINSYRYRIFEKLGVKNDVELTLLAIRHGLINPDEVLT